MPSQRRKVNLLGLSRERRYNSTIWSSEISRLSRLGIAILPRWPSSCMSGFISWPGRRPNRSLDRPAEFFYSRNWCQGALESQRRSAIRPTAVGFAVPPPAHSAVLPVSCPLSEFWPGLSLGSCPVVSPFSVPFIVLFNLLRFSICCCKSSGEPSVSMGWPC